MTDWREETSKQLDTIADLRSQIRDLEALAVRFATELGRRKRFRDHACVQCFGPEAEHVIEGFVCVYHEAAALLADPRYLKIKEGKG